MGNTPSDQWEGPPDAYSSAQHRTNARFTRRKSIVESIIIKKYWDVYSPPPKDSTKAKFGNTFAFLVDFGRQRRISLESHRNQFIANDNGGSPSSASGSNAFETKYFLRISKQQDDDNYKTKYLIDVKNFEIVSIDNERKEIIYKSYDNGDEYEGSFIFTNYTLEDVDEFRYFMNLAARGEDNTATSLATSESNHSNYNGVGDDGIRTGASSDSFDSRMKNDKYATSIEASSSNGQEPKSPSESTIDALVKRKDTDSTTPTTITKQDDYYINSPLSSHNGSNGYDNTKNGIMEQNNLVLEKDFYPIEAASPTRRFPTKRNKKSPRAYGSNNFPNSPRKEARQKAEAILEGTEEDEKGDDDDDDNNNNSGDELFLPSLNYPASATGATNNGSRSSSPASSLTSASRHEEEEKKKKKKKGFSRFSLPYRKKEGVSSAQKEGVRSRFQSPDGELNGRLLGTDAIYSSPTFHTDNRNGGQMADIEAGFVDNSAINNNNNNNNNNEQQNNAQSRSASSNPTSPRKRGCCHGSYMIFVNILHVKGILVSLGMTFIGILLNLQPVRLVLLSDTVMIWSALIFIANASGLLGVYQACCDGICFISMSMALGVLLIMVNFAMPIIFSIKEGEFLDYLSSHSDYIPFIDEARVAFLSENVMWVYIAFAMNIFVEMMRLFVLSKLKKSLKSNRSGVGVSNNEGLTEPLL